MQNTWSLCVPVYVSMYFCHSSAMFIVFVSIALFLHKTEQNLLKSPQVASINAKHVEDVLVNNHHSGNNLLCGND